jgi:hypothetical protein
MCGPSPRTRGAQKAQTEWVKEWVAEADGNRTRQRQDLPLVGFEDRAGHQTGDASLDHGDIMTSLPVTG